MSRPAPLRLLTLATLGLAAAACQSTDSEPLPQATALKLFTDHVRPILQQNCLSCHSGQTPGLLDLSNRAAAFLPRPDGRAYIVPGQPDQSLLIEAVGRSGIHQQAMPRNPMSLTEDDIGTLREWIDAGAPWPTGPAGELRTSTPPSHAG